MSAYDQVMKMTKCLNLPEQLQLLESLSRMVRAQVTEAKPHNIMELESLGAEIWQDVDAQVYIDQERASWESRQSLLGQTRERIKNDTHD
jgi:hypothetical protein